MSALLLGLSLYSYHLQDKNDRFENSTQGVYVSQTGGAVNFGAGVYSNSIERVSYWGGVTFGDNFRTTVGAVSGYNRGLLPFVVFGFVQRINNNLRGVVNYVPPMPRQNYNGVINFSIEMDLK